MARRRRLSRKRIARKAARTRKLRKEIALFEAVYKALQDGKTPFEIALRFNMTIKEVERIVRKVRRIVNEISEVIQTQEEQNKIEGE